MPVPTTLLIAGNGAIGSRVASRMAEKGCDVLVHHTGRRVVPQARNIAEIRAAPSPAPIRTFPPALLERKFDVAIHFYCMGRPDAEAFIDAFDGLAVRLVLISSCDVYRAYGRFIGTEPGPPDPTPLDEGAPLRARLHPYRTRAAHEDAVEHWYEKLNAERIVASARKSEFVILRLPKVYGPDTNEHLGTIYGFAHQPAWRWTHGHADNVAAAVSLAALHPKAAREIFNLGEADTPTIGERLTDLLPRRGFPIAPGDYDFAQNMHCDTSKVRRVLGYRDEVDEGAAMRVVAGARRADPEHS